MKASVVIATYNGEKYIEEQLESIVSQTVLPYEVIISDDASTDDTITIVTNIIEKYKNLPINFKVLHNQGKHGIVENFENAFLHVTGDVVFLCDQDDIWFENKVEKILEIMSIHEENVVIHDALILLQEANEFTITNRNLMMWKQEDFDISGIKKISKEKYFASAFKSNFIQGMCMCVRTEFLKNILPISRGYMHDGWINFCATCEDSYIAVNEKLAFYRIHQNNICGISELNRKRPLKDRMKTFDEQGKKSIVHQYLWYRDTFEYAKQVDIPETLHAYEFFCIKRIDILQKHAIKSLVLLYKQYREGVYKTDGKIVFIHDIWFVIHYSVKQRKMFMNKLKDYKKRGYISKEDK